MLQTTDPIPQEVINNIVVELENLMIDALDKWSLPKRNSDQAYWVWSSKEQAYGKALELLADAGLAPEKYKARK